MNRIILIGNGFDLAHGMKTKYTHFLNDYWQTTITEIQKQKDGIRFENKDLVIDKRPLKGISDYSYSVLKKSLKHNNANIIFKNQFLKTITEKTCLKNWVDIEHEFYSLLKETVNNIDEENNYSIDDLNRDFLRIQNLLKAYLIKEQNNQLRVKKLIGRKIYSPFKLKDFKEESINQKVEYEYNKILKDIKGLEDDIISIEELSARNQELIRKLNYDNNKPVKKIKEEIRQLLLSENSINYFELIPKQTLFLNFNYTSYDLYDNQDKFSEHGSDRKTVQKFIHIHGCLDNQENNPIIFGFGDELDESYHSIERINDNRYLENIKSIKYLETDNYKNLLKFLNDDNYQIFIFGHSCSTSDRTLLNTLFEHQNCVSIKPFYHEKSKGDDNYSDIVKNISRNFINKVEMRSKVVNKRYCESLT